MKVSSCLIAATPAYAGGGGPSLDTLTHDRVMPGATLLLLAALVLSLLLAFRRQRLAAPGTADAGVPEVPGPLREVRLFRLRYAVTVGTGRLEAAGRSARRRALRTAAGRLVPWRTPAGTADPAPTDLLTGVEAGGRVIASFHHATGTVALHEADLEMLHGLGRRGRGLILLPLILATTAFVAMTHAALKDFLPLNTANTATSGQDLWLSVIVAAALFAFTVLAVLAVAIGLTSAVLRRVRRAQLRRRYEPELLILLAAAATAAATDTAGAAQDGNGTREPPRGVVS